ncbi:type II toxin-antitoxin system Phd/YefM family antitoxin [Desulfonema magnum]|uniref:Toxin-antitoxin system, antitoxin component n=1 Tax=Desulfonema magnum TaxID=45655 RepID=A0A975GTQ7_9BACT|nr:type II toxin-antitoxin system Phd/YefM family antitoxin [Desulfonema magnum]QTA93359.1 Toxin-antitoxin system, antitoxin component [Desulfonema magnum]
MQIPAEQFKERCMELIENIQKNPEDITITHSGRPVAHLIPFLGKKERTQEIFGFLKGMVEIREDIIKPLEEKWKADE